MPFPTEPHFVDRAEEVLGARLPAAFREYLLRSNGGEIAGEDEDWQIFPVFDDTDRKRAARSASHIVREAAKTGEWRLFPIGAIAFGANGSGDLVVFLPSLDNPEVLDPTVHLWRHETGSCELVSADFEEFAGGRSDVQHRVGADRDR